MRATALRCPICGDSAEPLASYEPLALEHCANCDFAFRPADVEELRDAHDEDYFAGYKGGIDTRQRWRDAHVRVKFVSQQVPDGTLLEIGCGSGHFLAAAHRTGYPVMGVEQSPTALEQGGVPIDFTVKYGPIEDVRLPSNGFNIVCGWHVLEHIPDPVPVLAKLHDALRPGGLAIFEVPNRRSVVARRAGLAWRHLDPEHHVGHHTPKSLRELLQRTGFEVVELTTVPMFTYLGLSRLTPRWLIRQARFAATMRARPFGSHPHKHELLRIVAKRV